jgi:hypothetical protein
MVTVFRATIFAHKYNEKGKNMQEKTCPFACPFCPFCNGGRKAPMKWAIFDRHTEEKEP